MKILITGAQGQLGQTIMNSTHDTDHELYFTSRSVGQRGVSSHLHTLLQLDISDSGAVYKVLKDNEIDIIVNCAGYTDVAKAETESEAAYKANSEAVAILAGAASETGALLIHFSTDYIFDGKTSVPYSEEDIATPLNEYGRSKLAGEGAILKSGCRYMIFRTSWLFSRYGHNFLKTILAKAESQPVINVVSDQIGSPTFAEDLVEMIFHVIDNGMLDRTGIYNFSNEGVCSWYDFAKAICEEAGTLCEVMPCRTEDYPVKVVRPGFSVLDKTKIKKTFSIDIPHWRDSMSFCVAQIEKFG